MVNRKSMFLAVAGWLVLSAGAASAAELSLEQAIRRTLESNPSLRAEGAAIEALEWQGQLAGLAPPMTVAAELENFAGTGAVSGIRAAEATLQLSRVLEMGGKRDARQARSAAIVATQRNVNRQRRLDLAAEATRRYILVASGGYELDLAGKQLEVARETESLVALRIKRGVAPEMDLPLVQIAVVRAEIEREHAEHELASAQFALASLWGESKRPDIQASADLFKLPALQDFEKLANRLAATPEFLAYTLQAEQLDAEQSLARAAAKPDYSVALGVRRLEALNDQALLMSFSMPLGTVRRSSYAIARTDAELVAVQANREADILEARQRLYAKFQELRHARTEFDALSERMIPAADRALALTRAGYESARYSILQLTQTQAVLLQLQHDRLGAATRYHQLLAEIERATADGAGL